MNPEVLRQRLIQAARGIPRDESVPPGFEQRVMRAIHALPPADPLAEWLLGLRRAAISAMSLAAVAIFVHLLLPSGDPTMAEASPGPNPLEAALLADVSSLLSESLLEDPIP